MTITKEERARLRGVFSGVLHVCDSSSVFHKDARIVLGLLDALAAAEKARDDVVGRSEHQLVVTLRQAYATERAAREQAERELAEWRKGNLWRVRAEQAERERDAIEAQMQAGEERGRELVAEAEHDAHEAEQRAEKAEAALDAQKAVSTEPARKVP